MLTNYKGYTLIELIVVIVLIGIMMTLSVPRFRDTVLTDNLKGSSRKLVGLINSLREDAVREQKSYNLNFDLETNRFWVDSSSMSQEKLFNVSEKAEALPPDVHIIDIWYQQEEKKVSGVASIRFSKKGYVQPSAIHLGEKDGRKFTLELTPFLGKVKLYNRYVEFE